MVSTEEEKKIERAARILNNNKGVWVTKFFNLLTSMKPYDIMVHSLFYKRRLDVWYERYIHNNKLALYNYLMSVCGEDE